MLRRVCFILVTIVTIVSILSTSKQVLAVEPAWIDVSNIATIPENPVVGDVFSCLIVTSYSNPDKLACGLVVPGAADNTRAIDICMKNEKAGTGYQGYGNGTRGYKCITNTHPNNTVTPGEFDLVAVSFDCDGNCSKIVKRHRMRILDRSQAPTATQSPPTQTPAPPTPTEYIPPAAIPTEALTPTSVPLEPDPTVVISQIIPRLEVSLPYQTYNPMQNSSDAPLVAQQPYSVPMTQNKYDLANSFQTPAILRPEIINKGIGYTTTFIENTFRPFTQRSDIKLWESTKMVISSLYLNFINEAGL